MALHWKCIPYLLLHTLATYWSSRGYIHFFIMHYSIRFGVIRQYFFTDVRYGIVYLCKRVFVRRSLLATFLRFSHAPHNKAIFFVVVVVLLVGTVSVKMEMEMNIRRIQCDCNLYELYVESVIKILELFIQSKSTTEFLHRTNTNKCYNKLCSLTFYFYSPALSRWGKIVFYKLWLLAVWRENDNGGGRRGDGEVSEGGRHIHTEKEREERERESIKMEVQNKERKKNVSIQYHSGDKFNSIQLNIHFRFARTPE